MRILNGDNLQILKSLEGERFDLAELDGPYMAGLEGWDILTEAEYIQHYAERLTALRPLLQPWGVVFVFGYPEGCAEIKSWAHRTETLYLRRWLTWYKQITAHKGRKVENVLLFTNVSNSIGSYEGLTNIDYFSKTYIEKTETLNDDGLRSKPVGLYVDLFKPTIPQTEKRKALVLYGGSGNAAIAAEALGYEVTVIEQDPKRCKLIEKRSSRLVQIWRERLSQGSLWGFPTQRAADGGNAAPEFSNFE